MPEQDRKQDTGGMELCGERSTGMITLLSRLLLDQTASALSAVKPDKSRYFLPGYTLSSEKGAFHGGSGTQ